MSMFHTVPVDVRETIDRIDTKLTSLDERLAVISELIAEQNSLLINRKKEAS